MRRTVTTVFLMIACTAPAHAECARGQSPDVLAVTDWSVDVGPDRFGMITSKTDITVSNTTEKSIRMVDGQVSFYDALGGYISTVNIERDLRIDAGGEASWQAEYGGTHLDRIPNLVRDEIAVEACVRAVLFDDGSKADFATQ